MEFTIFFGTISMVVLIILCLASYIIEK